MSSSTSPKLNMADIPSINLGTFILDKMKEHNQTSVALVSELNVYQTVRISNE